MLHEWHGNAGETMRLIAAIVRHCEKSECKPARMCMHCAKAIDQRYLDGLLFAYHFRERWLREEGLADGRRINTRTGART